MNNMKKQEYLKPVVIELTSIATHGKMSSATEGLNGGGQPNINFGPNTSS